MLQVLPFVPASFEYAYLRIQRRVHNVPGMGSTRLGQRQFGAWMLQSKIFLLPRPQASGSASHLWCFFLLRSLWPVLPQLELS